MIALPVVIIASIALLVVAPEGHRISFFLFGLGASAMLAVSSTYHRGTWTDQQWWTLRKLDMSAIYLLIAGAYTGVTAGMGDPWRTRLVVAAWLGALIGTAIRWLPIKPPFGLTNTVFMVVGGTFVTALPQLRDHLGTSGFWLLMGGCSLYLLGALMLGARWPNPAPKWFGYHEVWHLMVIGALVLHYLVMFTAVRHVA